jgi:hypothetical protein
MGHQDPQSSSTLPLTTEQRKLRSRMAGKLNSSALTKKPLAIRRGPDQPQPQQQQARP